MGGFQVQVLKQAHHLHQPSCKDTGKCPLPLYLDTPQEMVLISRSLVSATRNGVWHLGRPRSIVVTPEAGVPQKPLKCSVIVSSTVPDTQQEFNECFKFLPSLKDTCIEQRNMSHVWCPLSISPYSVITFQVVSVGTLNLGACTGYELTELS